MNDRRAERMPTLYLPHGGGPWPFVEMGLDVGETSRLLRYLESLSSLAPTPPTAILVVSAHWEQTEATVMTSNAPPMLYDYSGFPDPAFSLSWPAPGAPKLAARVRTLLDAAGIASSEDASRGFDHGTFVPLKVAWPEPSIPTTQLSLLSSLDATAHIRLGQALAPLRDEGILIVGSGMSFHNMRGFFSSAPATAPLFDAWLRETAVCDEVERNRRLSNWLQAPGARDCHPREEHLLPLMVVAGAAGNEAGRVAYNEQLMGVPVTAVHFG